MSYKKILLDNTTCLRRFHLTYNDEDEAAEQVDVKCLHCGIVIFSRKNHPPVTLARDENLIKTTDLSSNRLKTCAFKDNFSVEPQPK